MEYLIKLRHQFKQTLIET